MKLLSISLALACSFANAGVDTKSVRMQGRAMTPKVITFDTGSLTNEEFESLAKATPSQQQLRDDEYAIGNLSGMQTEIWVADKGEAYDTKVSFKVNEVKSLEKLYIAIANPQAVDKFDSYVVKYKHRYVLRLNSSKQVVLQEVKS